MAPSASSPPRLLPCVLAEAVGTFILVFLGCGSVHSAVLTGSLVGLGEVAIVWGIAIMAAVFSVGSISGAHINPAITVALAAWGRFDPRRVVPYIVGQFGGAFLAAAALFVLFNPWLKVRESESNVVRGEPGSEITAMCYGEYFPNPGLLSGSDGYSTAEHARLNERVSEIQACLAELLGTLLLGLVVAAVSDDRNAGGPKFLAPAFIGLTVAALISVLAPLTQACFNPARDFGPRLFAMLAGWGPIALPGPRGMGWLTVYILSPTCGAVLGMGVYQAFRAPPGDSTETTS